MNTGFIIKMAKAEKLRYEAVKEILPECMKSKVDKLENEMLDIAKQIAYELIREDTSNKQDEPKKDIKKISLD